MRRIRRLWCPLAGLLVLLFSQPWTTARASSTATNDYFVLRDGLANCRAKFEREKTGRVVFLGGSITFNPGWRDETITYLRRRFPQTQFEFISTGIPSLGSVPHAFRFERDVLARGPVDLLFVEAAVNDQANARGRDDDPLLGMEGVVRHARMANPQTDIVHMHFVMPEHMADYRAGRVPAVIAQHERVATCYGNPSLDLAREVTDRIAAGEFTWAGDFKDLHPSPFGQRIYARSIERLLEAAFVPAGPPRPHPLPAEPLDARSYFHGRFGAPGDVEIVRGFAVDPHWRPARGATRDGFVNVPALVATEPGSEFRFAFTGRGVGLFLAAGPDTGVLEFSVDGAAFRRVDTFTPWSKGLHLPWALMLDSDLPPGRHEVRVKLTAEHNPAGSGTALRVVHLLLN